MLHRAILGSFERFIGILIEHHSGKFPLWLAPVQVVVAPITEAFNDYALQVVGSLKAQGFRVESDLRNEKISYKIRELSHAKVPLIIVVGQREQEDNTVAVRELGSNAQSVVGLETFIKQYQQLTLPPQNKNGVQQ